MADIMSGCFLGQVPSGYYLKVSLKTGSCLLFRLYPPAKNSAQHRGGAPANEFSTDKDSEARRG